MAALIRRSALSLLLAWMSGAAVAASPEALPSENSTELEDGAVATSPPASQDSRDSQGPASADDAVTSIAPAITDPPGEPPAPVTPAPPHALLDRAHEGLHSMLWRSAMHIDQWFGSEMPEATYQSRAIGSITPAIQWDQRGGVSQSLKFRVKIPLPYLGQRYQAFIGTFNRDEFVTERNQASGTIPTPPRARTTAEDDQQTLLGIGYRNPDRDSHFDADVGIRIRTPLDPFIKGSYRYGLGSLNALRLGLRETAFWQNSEGLGVTSRIDVEHLFRNDALLSWSGSATFSQESKGVRGYTSLTAFRPLSSRRAIGAQVFAKGELDAQVPLEDYGLKLSFRQRVWRDWLVLEIRPSATYPREFRFEERKLNLGIGVGFEIFFGTVDYQARPAMF